MTISASPSIRTSFSRYCFDGSRRVRQPPRLPLLLPHPPSRPALWSSRALIRPPLSSARAAIGSAVSLSLPASATRNRQCSPIFAAPLPPTILRPHSASPIPLKAPLQTWVRPHSPKSPPKSKRPSRQITPSLPRSTRCLHLSTPPSQQFALRFLKNLPPRRPPLRVLRPWFNLLLNSRGFLKRTIVKPPTLSSILVLIF